MKIDFFKLQQELFAARHTYPDASFHRDIVNAFWSSRETFIILAFRWGKR